MLRHQRYATAQLSRIFHGKSGYLLLTAEDFKVFHPGGQLGRKLFKVEDLMHIGDELPLVQEDTPMSEVVIVMTKKTFGVAGVIDSGGRLAGIVTARWARSASASTRRSSSTPTPDSATP